MKKVNIQALKVRPGKNQSMVAGKVYAVSEAMADVLIKGNKAVKAKDDSKPGDVYELPEDPNKDLLGGDDAPKAGKKKNRGNKKKD